MERFWLRSYDPVSDRESWSNPIDIHTAKRLELDVQRKGHTTRIYTEVEMQQFDPPPCPGCGDPLDENHVGSCCGTG